MPPSSPISPEALPAATPRRRATFNMDLGPLRAEAERCAAARSVRLSTWLRELVAREVQASAPPAPTPQPAVPAIPATTGPTIRVELDAGSGAVLDRLVEAGRFRTRTAALRVLLAGVSPTAGAELPAAVRELVQSNAQLVGVARRLQSLDAAIKERGPAPLLTIHQLTLIDAEKAVRAHVRSAGQVLNLVVPALRPAATPATRAPGATR